MKLEHVPVSAMSLLKLTFHISSRIRQVHSACIVSSGCALHSEQTSSLSTFLQTRLTFVGNKLVPAHQTKVRTLLGTRILHIAFQTLEITPRSAITCNSVSSYSIKT